MHRTTEEFWQRYNELPEEVRSRVESAFALLRSNPLTPRCNSRESAISGQPGSVWSFEHWPLKTKVISFGSGSDHTTNTSEF
jgi:hypothetical protein